MSSSGGRHPNPKPTGAMEWWHGPITWWHDGQAKPADASGLFTPCGCMDDACRNGAFVGLLEGVPCLAAAKRDPTWVRHEVRQAHVLDATSATNLVLALLTLVYRKEVLPDYGGVSTGVTAMEVAGYINRGGDVAMPPLYVGLHVDMLPGHRDAISPLMPEDEAAKLAHALAMPALWERPKGGG